jgi:hypothetical protein
MVTLPLDEAEALRRAMMGDHFDADAASRACRSIESVADMERKLDDE